MYNNVQQYELSFVPPERRPRTDPEIVVTIAAEHLEEVGRRLDILHSHAAAVKYCGEETEWHQLQQDMFGNIVFGYNNCAYVRIEDGKAELRLKLREDLREAAALTLKYVLDTLAVPLPGARSNLAQQVDIQTQCGYRSMGYGHASGGYVSQRLLTWLRSVPGKPDFMGMKPMPKKVVTAMRQAWTAVAKIKDRRWASECCAIVTEDGRFMLQCFGNACDLSIYPDGTCGDAKTDPFVRFSCHNLDRADQQLTLIAGLARMCELARQDE